jgi:hypothetical protein
MKNEELLKEFPPEIVKAFKIAGIHEIKVINEKVYIMTYVHPNTATEIRIRREIDEAIKAAGYTFKWFRDSYSCQGRFGYGDLKKKE